MENFQAMRLLMTLLYPLLFILPFIHAARILAIFPTASKSRFYFNNAIMESLAAAGHHITLINPFQPDTELENLTVVNSRFDKTLYVSNMPLRILTELNLNSFLDKALDEMEAYCYNIMKLPIIQDGLNSNEKLYDVMFTDLFLMYRCYFLIAEKLDIPVIGTNPSISWLFTDTDMGYPNNPAILRLEFFDFGTTPTFFQRLKNFWGHLLVYYRVYFSMPAKMRQFAQKYFPESKWILNKKVSLMFINNYASILPRPTTPNVIPIGGIHVQPAKPLPQDLQEFIDSAKNGVVLFTLGSLINASTIPSEMRTAFVNAFAAIPQRVIWKFEGSIEGISDNVLLSSWVPQRDILEHRNVKTFISHCGIGAMYEAIYTGTPIITVPVFFDQNPHAAHLEELGVSVRLNLDEITTAKVLEALHAIINDTGYHERMQNFSRRVRDRPMTPQQTVVYWTEYVIKHKGAPYLQSTGSDMPLYQYFFFDVLLLATVFITFLLTLMFYVIKKF